MKRQLTSILLAAGMLALTGCMALETPASSDGDQTAPEPSAGVKSRPAEEGELGEYHVKILEAETGLKDYDGNPVIGVQFAFTNNSSEAAAFDLVLYATAYQDGVELDPAILEEMSEAYQNASRNIKPGKTLTCETYYVMTGEDCDVEVEVTELLPLDDSKVTRTFAVEAQT